MVCCLVQAAAISVHCCVSPKLLETHDGGFFDNCKAIRVPEVMCSRSLQVTPFLAFSHCDENMDRY
jgi:hypothetical protein